MAEGNKLREKVCSFTSFAPGITPEKNADSHVASRLLNGVSFPFGVMHFICWIFRNQEEKEVLKAEQVKENVRIWQGALKVQCGWRGVLARGTGLRKRLERNFEATPDRYFRLRPILRLYLS